MPVYRLDHRIAFPRPELADDNGILAVGGDLRPERLLFAYQLGIFPWYEQDLPIIWHSPDPRMVLDLTEVHVPRTVRKVMRRGTYEIRMDTAFADVIEACSLVPRPGQDGTWITREMIDAYIELHRLGYGHSVEAWQDGALVGGAYGVSLGRAFFGESMFAERPDASKVAFISLCDQLQRWDFDFVDCQVHTEHLARFGATEWTRELYLDRLARAVAEPTRMGVWQFDSIDDLSSGSDRG